MGILRDVLDGSKKPEPQEMTLLYYVTFDLKNTFDDKSVYKKIEKAIEAEGYTRDTNIEEDALPYNFYAGQKKITFDSSDTTLLKEIAKEKEAFKNVITSIIDSIAPGKRERLFLSVSDAAHTKFHVD
ncbi:hypothetical protein H5A33_06610 [Pectobacterium brasiliense]|uniref:hypothetical protein n=1 Tax=Pectobacterium TaxID=122277 RepID=UPI00196985C7|nr:MULTISPECIES: hypothetical protein [Pectobacterium]MBN3237676.1 hypothetical protein [Pectobacterium versatile]MBN3254297.1 hypothetical protein [Pectobacterium brasiliense]